jgi:DNA polymerase epsilon subunit 1
MEWMWRGEYYPATREETEAVRSQLHSESVGGVPYKDLPYDEQNALLKARLKIYCQTVYKHVKDTKELLRHAVICQRENPFYVQTVRAFRDRRYEYKGLTKKWHGLVVAVRTTLLGYCTGVWIV